MKQQNRFSQFDWREARQTILNQDFVSKRKA